MSSIRFMLLSTLLLIAATPVGAQSRPTQAPQEMRRLAGHLFIVIQHLQSLDAMTETETPVNLTGSSAPRFESSSLVMTWRVPELQVSKSMTNTVLGYPVPGRTVTTKLTVDCLVHGWLDPDKITAWRDPTSPGRLKMRVPVFSRFTAEFPEGADAKYEDEYGSLRSSSLDDDKARQLRKEMYPIAKEKAIEEIQKYLATNGASESNALSLAIQELIPSHAVHAAADSKGTELSIDNYLVTPKINVLEAPVLTAAPAERASWIVPVTVAVSLVVGLSIMLVWNHLKQRRLS